MFFRNQKPKQPSFDERIASLKEFGFSTQSEAGGCRVTRGGCAAIVQDLGDGKVGIGTASAAVSLAISATDAMLLPKGTTAQQPTGVAGYLRFNTTTSQFEGYNGTAWASVGGAAISNDTSTASYEYPLFAAATTGTPTTIYTSNAKYLYKPSTGDLQASQIAASNGLVLNNATISTSYTVASGYNAMSVGPVTMGAGISVTLPSGSRWMVL